MSNGTTDSVLVPDPREPLIRQLAAFRRIAVDGMSQGQIRRGLEEFTRETQSLRSGTLPEQRCRDSGNPRVLLYGVASSEDD